MFTTYRTINTTRQRTEKEINKTVQDLRGTNLRLQVFDRPDHNELVKKIKQIKGLLEKADTKNCGDIINFIIGNKIFEKMPSDLQEIIRPLDILGAEQTSCLGNYTYICNKYSRIFLSVLVASSWSSDKDLDKLQQLLNEAYEPEKSRSIEIKPLMPLSKAETVTKVLPGIELNSHLSQLKEAYLKEYYKSFDFQNHSQNVVNKWQPGIADVELILSGKSFTDENQSIGDYLSNGKKNNTNEELTIQIKCPPSRYQTLIPFDNYSYFVALYGDADEFH